MLRGLGWVPSGSWDMAPVIGWWGITAFSQTLALTNLAFFLNNFFHFPWFWSWSALLLMLISVYISNSDLSFTSWISLLGCHVGISNTGSKWNHVPLSIYCHVSLLVHGPVHQKSQGHPRLLFLSCPVCAQLPSPDDFTYWTHSESVRSLPPHCCDCSLCCHLLLSGCGNGLLTVLPLRVLHPVLPLNPLSTQ